MQLIQLTLDRELTAFDCGDSDLNAFLFEDAKPALELHIANTFILEDDGRIAAYFCLLNDRISRNEIIGSRWKKIRNCFPKSKQFRSYPCVKIGRFAVALEYRGRRIGTELMDNIKQQLRTAHTHSAFRYITVDAYNSAIPFYEKNGFHQLTQKEEDEQTRLMFFDMMEISPK
ncbi:MAG: GNAT family N-acetyltransferase [Prevotella sp.]|nr:GNAT family N-acetyltransferase [Prevotella sp.]